MTASRSSSSSSVGPALAAAADRLRAVPGFPRRPGRPRQPESGHVPGTSSSGGRVNGGRDGGAPDSPSLAPRLLDLRTTAAYLSVSDWTVRDLEAAGVLARVRVPLPRGGELRKLLFDRADLDRLIGVWKDPAPHVEPARRPS